MKKRRNRPPAARNYPKTIRVRRRTWKVEFVYVIPLTEKLEGSERETHVIDGHADRKTRTIWLRRGQTQKELLSTFIHETLHAIAIEYKIHIPHPLIHELEGPIAALIIANGFVCLTNGARCGRVKKAFTG